MLPSSHLLPLLLLFYPLLLQVDGGRVDYPAFLLTRGLGGAAEYVKCLYNHTGQGGRFPVLLNKKIGRRGGFPAFFLLADRRGERLPVQFSINLFSLQFFYPFFCIL